MSEFTKRLGKLKSNWKKAQDREPGSFGGTTVEDGIYVARVTLAEVTESQNGRTQVHWEYTIVEGEEKGTAVHDYDGLETEDNLFFLQRKLARLDKEIPDDPSEIEEILAEITKEKPTVKVRVKTKDEYTHVYINRMVSGDGEGSEDEDGPAEEAEESDTPESEEEPKEPESESEPESEPESEEEDEEVELTEGMKVTFKSGGKDLEGEILEFVEDDSKARVKTAKGTFKVKIDVLTPVEGEAEPEPEPEEKPKKSNGKDKAKGKVSKVKK